MTFFFFLKPQYFREGARELLPSEIVVTKKKPKRKQRKKLPKREPVAPDPAIEIYEREIEDTAILSMMLEGLI